MDSKLIVALDFDNERDALSLVEQLDPNTCKLKVGSELFTRFGAPFVKRLVQNQFKVFLDLKFHDIPNTVAKACQSAADLGVWMLNVHAAGGLTMMQTAKEALESYGKKRPLLIAVTLLTSMDESELPSIGISLSLNQQVSKLAQLAMKAKLDGVVCSAHEAAMIKSTCGKHFLAITPGIRMPDQDKHDQNRIITPMQALNAGSDYLVIGRPITRAKNPMTVVDDLLKLM